MPQEIEKPDGTKETVYTQAELDEQKTAAVFAATSPLQQQLDSAKTDLAKASDKDLNFATLRQKVTDLETKIGTAKADALAEFESNSRTQMADDAITRLADGDQALKDKIAFHYKKLGAEAKTTEEVREAVRGAFVLARQGESGPDLTSAAFSSGGVGGPAPRPPQASDKAPLSDNQKAFLKMAYPDLTDQQMADLDKAAKPPKVGPIDGNFGKITV